MIKLVKLKLWNPVMSSEHNPLMALPSIQRYQVMMVLAMMWSFIFCSMIGWILLFPYWIVGHILLLSMGAFFTNYTFESYSMKTHRDMYISPDKTHALHDDIWGA
jgi:hypothetical protein